MTQPLPRVDIELCDEYCDQQNSDSISHRSISSSPDSLHTCFEPLSLSNSDDEWDTPSLSLQARIVETIESLFHNDYLLKDAFLLKHVRKNKEGYVNIKLITSFKRVKYLTKNWRHVAHSLRLSDKLALNPEGTKVKRLEPIPDFDETAPSRTVVCLSQTYTTIADISKLLSPCGEIASLRLYRPGKPLPSEIKSHFSDSNSNSKNVISVVEFETLDGARSGLSLGKTRPDISIEEFIIRRSHRYKARENDWKKTKEWQTTGKTLTIPTPSSTCSSPLLQVKDNSFLDLGYASAGSPWLTPAHSSENLFNQNPVELRTQTWDSLHPADAMTSPFSFNNRRLSDPHFVADINNKPTEFSSVFSPNYYDRNIFK